MIDTTEKLTAHFYLTDRAKYVATVGCQMRHGEPVNAFARAIQGGDAVPIPLGQIEWPYLADHLPEGGRLLVVPSEDLADRLAARSFSATTIAGGECHEGELGDALAGRLAAFELVVLTDGTSDNRCFTEKIAGAMIERGRPVFQLSVPEREDLADWIIDRPHADRLALVASAPPFADKQAPITYLDLDGPTPSVPWLIPGWLAVDDIGLFVGGASTGKSTTAGALAQALARGEPWCDIEPVRACRVLILDEEHAELTARRLYSRLGGSHENLKIASETGIHLADSEQVARLEWALKTFKPALVIVDSVQRLFLGVHENSATEVGEAFAVLSRLRTQYGCAFLLIHHKRKDAAEFQSSAIEKVRGSTAFGTQADTIWFARPARDGRLAIVQVKRRGAERTSMLTEYSDEGPDGRITITGLGAVDDAADRILAAKVFVNEYLIERGESRRKDIEEGGKVRDMPRRTIGRALAALLEDDEIEKPRRGIYRPKR